MATHSGSRQYRLEKILSEHANGILDGNPFQDILHQLAQGIAYLIGNSENLVRIWLQDAPNHAGPENYCVGIWPEFMMSEVDRLFLRVIDTRKALLLNERRTQFQHHAEYHLQSALVVPLIHSDTCFGAIFVGSENPRQFTASALPWVNMLAHQVCQTIAWEQARLMSAARPITSTTSSAEGIFAGLQRLAEECVQALEKEKEREREKTR
ncbi:MAG TPA: GAF domain-containing protein, partial [Ktedonobacterales bacterium]|nr:GAF domain-containing protein [Ktedonobacterales bacterium]